MSGIDLDLGRGWAGRLQGEAEGSGLLEGAGEESRDV